MIEFDIYDPSFFVNTSYWQIGVASKNAEIWDEVKKCINRALPQRRGGEFDRTTSHERELEFWGCVKHKEIFWLYRHFLTGRDSAGRPGRYFFVVFKIEGSLEEALGFVSKICRRLTDKVSIPLDLSDLSNGSELDSVKINLPDSINKKLEASSADVHVAWVIEKGKRVTEYADLEVPELPKNDSKGSDGFS